MLLYSNKAVKVINDDRELHDQLSIALVAQFVSKIKEQYELNKIQIKLFAKSSRYLRAKGWTAQHALDISVEHIDQVEYFRGPSKHHWREGVQVFEFIEYLTDLDMYVKFSVSDYGVEMMAFHEREKLIDSSWLHNERRN